MAHTGDFETHPIGTGERLKALEWRGIATAPKDGTDILAWWFGVSFPQIVRFTGLGSYSGPEWIQCSYSSASLPCEPTHWMPLPAPPADEISQRDAA